MDISIFTGKEKTPTNDELIVPLGDTFKLWMAIRKYVLEKYPDGKEDWNYPGKKYGWSFTIKEKKRAIVYFLPREGYFKVAFIFGQKAFNQIMESDISAEIKTELENARVYAEGRGIRISIKENSIMDDIKKLVEIKLAN